MNLRLVSAPLTTHHDGHGLNETIKVIATDELGPGGAHHRYVFTADVGGPSQESAGYLQFQKGPRGEEGSTPGVTEASVLAVLIDRLESFQAGPFACSENEAALGHLRAAMEWVHERAHARARRGVLGTNVK